ncbi:S49 family peptidase [Methylobacillus gramineus]|uniref:S49 family peptidase n=1 Tax=Methylobacillus gramineus TaxID=755169 RepID=UPI001D0002A7|nr:S49 family peptidase [Methylobacillus gramineus]MCB5184240.1 S49 family peptidase [Methylobacillus gramineus]
MSDNHPNGSNWERDTLHQLALATVKEQRRARQWGIFFKSVGFTYLFIVLFYALGWNEGSSASVEHTALIDISGVIGSDDAVNADSVVSSLQSAFDSKGTKGIILRINSPGGSPVQAGIINDEIKRQRKLHPNIPVYAVVQDICASGGYYIAVAADKIYVDKASIVGSIGVLMDGFGFTGVMDKVGVERRLMTAGSNKAMLDPFSPVNPKHKEFAQQMLDQIHAQFIAVVREGRGKRLKETEETFSGLFWSGEASVEMGLADALGSADYVAREVIKQENVVDFTAKEGLADRFAKRLGASVSASFLGKKLNLE